MSEEKLRDKLQAAALEGAVHAVFARSGVKMTKQARAYVESALSCEIRTGDSPVISAVDPVSGRTYASANEFAEALGRDPDFAPATSQSSSSRDGKPAVRHVKLEDLPRERVPLELIENGTVIVDMPEPVHRELQANEVSAHSQSQLNSSIEDIAAGRKQVVFPGRA
jgi:hypothetical protein